MGADRRACRNAVGLLGCARAQAAQAPSFTLVSQVDGVDIFIDDADTSPYQLLAADGAGKVAILLSDGTPATTTSDAGSQDLTGLLGADKTVWKKDDTPDNPELVHSRYTMTPFAGHVRGLANDCFATAA